MGLANALGPSQINVQPAPAVAGDFASANPRFNYLAGPGGLVAGIGGLTIGLFAWVTASPVDANGTPAWATNAGAGPAAGFVHREQQALITTYLTDAGMTIPAGFECGLMTGGDFWVVNSGTTEAEVGMKAYANFANGKATFAATGSPTNAATSTASTIAAETNGWTGSISGNLMTVTAVSSGTLVPGTQVSGTGVAANTAILGQVIPLLAGETLGGIGRYTLNVPEQIVASEAMTGTYGLLTVGGTLTGTYAVGQTLTSAVSGFAAGTQITGLGTGTGGAGTYYVNLTQTVGSGIIDASVNVETKWIAMSAGLAGELIKISSQALG
jgi:hypothetical protein